MNDKEARGNRPTAGATETTHPPESVVLILQGTSPADHPGIVDGYERLRASGVVSHLSVFPVFGPAGVAQGNTFWNRVISQAHDASATLVVFQYYHSDRLPDPRPAITQLKRLPSRPTIVSTLGDAFMNGYFGRPSVARSFLQAAAVSDLVTLTSMGVLADYVARHTHAPIVLSPNAACQVRFGTPQPAPDLHAVEFDVAFIGSRNRSRNPGKGYYWLGRRRERLVEQLTRRYGRGFAVFGKGWDHLPSAQGPVPFHEQARAASRARVVVGGVPFSRTRYYTSDRPFIQTTSGVPVVDVAVPGVETILRDGEHWVLADGRTLTDRIDDVIGWGDEARQEFGRAAVEYTLRRHTQACRVAELVENVRRQRWWRDGNDRIGPLLAFFLDEVDSEREEPLATRNWRSRRPRP